MIELTKDELLKRYEDYLTVGDIKKFIEKYNLPDHSKVLVQRVEDVYYENHHWGVYLKDGDNTITIKDDDGNDIKYNQEQYHPAWCCTRYNDDADILFIDMYY